MSNFGGDRATQLNLKKTFCSIIYAVLRTWRSIAATRSQFLRRLLRDHAQTAAVGNTVEEIRGHTSLSTALVRVVNLIETSTKIEYRVVTNVLTSPLTVSLSVSGLRTEQCWSLHSAFLSSNAVLFLTVFIP